MNDAEQRNAEIRELLLADSGATFVDFSKELTLSPNGFDISKAQQEYHFYFIHDQTSEQN